MTAITEDLTRKVYGGDIWEGFIPASSDDLQGWNGDHPSLAELAQRSGEVIVVDVGVWKGQSTITMANAMRAAGINGCVIAVDTFLGSVEHWIKPERYFTPRPGGPALFERRFGRPDLYETFLSNVSRAGLQDYVLPLAQTSATAAQILQELEVRVDLVHIDAAHDYPDVMRDAQDYWRLLKPGGVLIGDDYAEAWPGVVKAAGEFSSQVGRPLRIAYPKWIIQKP